jgi:hypothetical protein
MSIDLNFTGTHFQAYATIFAAIALILFLFSQQTRAGLARLRRQYVRMRARIRQEKRR